MYTQLLQGQIIFYYQNSSLFDDVQHQSAFICKNIVSKEGEDLSERYAITNDEEPMFKLCLRETMPDVYDIVKPITYGIKDAWYDDITGQQLKNLDTSLSVLVVENTGYYTVIRVQNNKAYNPNTVKLVDSALRSTIEQGVLANFYTRVTHPEITKMATTMYAGQSNALTQRIIPLRKKSKF